MINIREKLLDKKRYVVKLGTTANMDEDGSFNLELISGLARQMNCQRKKGKEFVIVSSGAIGLGNKELGWERSDDIVLNQVAASVGQEKLISSYSNAFNNYNIKTSQILLTHDAFTDDKRKVNAYNLINKSLEKGIVPIINENDSVSTEEITFGDNDMLSAYVSNMISSDALIMLTNVNGIYENVIKEDVIDSVTCIDDIMKSITKDITSVGKGGMYSKVMAAKQAATTNTMTVIASYKEHDVLYNIINGKKIGTFFCIDDKIY